MVQGFSWLSCDVLVMVFVIRQAYCTESLFFGNRWWEKFIYREAGGAMTNHGTPEKVSSLLPGGFLS